MRAVACEQTNLDVIDLPLPDPGKGQVLVDVLRCGICGSDLHARHHADEQADVLAEAGYHGFMRSDQQVTPREFRDTLHMLAEGKVNAAPLVTGTVGLPGVASAFEALGDPETHAKILIDPRSSAAEPTAGRPAG